MQLKTILIVDDEPDLRSSISLILKKSGFEVLEAETGLEAKSKLAASSIDVILSDIRMPDMTGIELLHHVKKTTGTPFIIMTGFSDIMEARAAFNIGANNFLPKPFTKDELLGALNLILECQRNDEINSHSLGQEFCKIPLEEFTSSSKLKVDIYLQLSGQKFLKVASHSSELSQERISHYRSRGLTHLYIKRKEFPKYVGLNLKVSEAAAKTQQIPRKKKFQILKHATEVILQDLYINGLDHEKFNCAKDLVDLIIETMARDEDLFFLLESLNANSDYLYAHSLGVSLFSSLIADELGWTSTETKFKISMGGLLHDFGKKELDPLVLQKSRKDLNRHEVSILESHPSRGMNLLKKIRSVPPEVVMIVLQHHENCLGSGFPGRLTKDEIHPFSRLVAVANCFCEQVLKGNHVVTYSPEEAINRILTYHENMFDQTILAALMKLFNHPALPEFLMKFENFGSKPKVS